jgi:adenylate kinase
VAMSWTGFHRTVRQAIAFEQHEAITAVIRFEITDEAVVSRLSGRKVCGSCRAIYYLKDRPPKVPGVCNECGGSLYTRLDDSRQSIENRLRVYKEQTEPLVQFYSSRNLLINIDSSISPEYSLAQINNIFGWQRRMTLSTMGTQEQNTTLNLLGKHSPAKVCHKNEK